MSMRDRMAEHAIDRLDHDEAEVEERADRESEGKAPIRGRTGEMVMMADAMAMLMAVGVPVMARVVVLVIVTVRHLATLPERRREVEPRAESRPGLRRCGASRAPRPWPSRRRALPAGTGGTGYPSG